MARTRPRVRGDAARPDGGALHPGAAPCRALGRFGVDDDRFAFGDGLSAGADATDRVIYDTSAGNLYYDADGDGAGAALLFATLQGAPALHADDIVVIWPATPADWRPAPASDPRAARAGIITP